MRVKDKTTTVQHRRLRDDFQKQCQFIERQYKYGTIEVSILQYLSMCSNILKHVTLFYPKTNTNPHIDIVSGLSSD